MRILVTGSRDWDLGDVIADVLWGLAGWEGTHTIVSGACPTGADRIAEELAEGWGWTIERHPAAWKTYPKTAGFIRNQVMVDCGADVCVAFSRNNSKGTAHCADAAEKVGIQVIWVEYPDDL